MSLNLRPLHEPGFIYRKATIVMRKWKERNCAWGSEKQYEEYTLEIEVGDSIILL